MPARNARRHASRTPASRTLVLLTLAGAWACAPAAEEPAAIGEHGSEGVGLASAEHADQVAAIDEIVMGPIRDGRIAGASVAVVQGGVPVAIRGYGWADLELDVPTPEDAVYEIGSVTKQFTSVALLKLQDEGLVDLDADMNEYLSDFPTQGNRITVRELLDHTSGIRGYTEMASAYPYFIRRVPPDSLMALVAAHPFDFSTGEHEIYNNSAFFLAGQIIEGVSGRTYEAYVEEEIFAPLGMETSHYCSETEIHEGKVNGYDAGEDGLRHKGFIVHNVPYAAGSLCASAADMATWLTALHGGEAVSDDGYRQLITPGDLNDGTELRYGLGMALSPILGHRAIHHGGGINGFLSQTLYLPDEELSVVVLVNTAGPTSPDSIAEAIVEVMVGDRTPEAGSYTGDLAAFEGVYAGPARGGRTAVRIAADGGSLTAATVMVGDRDVPEEDQEVDTLEFVEGTTFRDGGLLLTFDVDGGRAVRLRQDAAYGYSVLTRRP